MNRMNMVIYPVNVGAEGHLWTGSGVGACSSFFWPAISVGWECL